MSDMELTSDPQHGAWPVEAVRTAEEALLAGCPRTC